MDDLEKKADLIPRLNGTFGMGINEYNIPDKFIRLECENCNGLTFEVLSTRNWETITRCCSCGTYQVVHTG